MAGNNFNIKTPHAAVLIWNYVDRLGLDTTKKSTLNQVERRTISTLSCLSIQTSKSKMRPDGTFNLVLAPFKNWVSSITAGSWCCILMSNEPITEKDLQKCNKKHVKMIGRIDTVRVETKVQSDETRNTLYYVSGVDWGHIFNNILYIDNLIAGPNDPQSQGNSIAIALQNALFSKDGVPNSFEVKKNLANIISIFGKELKGFTENESDIGRLAKPIYNFNIPEDMAKFLQLKDPSGRITTPTKINKALTLVTGKLVKNDTYDNYAESMGFINPFSLQGQHSFWQVLLENSNPALNEMFCEMKWDDTDNNYSGISLTLYNRIKPFSFNGFGRVKTVAKNKKQANAQLNSIRSYFQYVKTHEIDPIDVISINAGTNWHDKYNFIEIKPEFQDFAVIANWYKQKSQKFDKEAFEREGFRPLIVSTKQFPKKAGTSATVNDVGADWDQLERWAELMEEWYFNTHRMLNGTLVMHGTTDYIAVGNNIRFDAGLINPTPNMKKTNVQKKDNQFVLAHVENVSHSFTINPENGARTYTTTIQFVRGIIVDQNNVSTDGLLDQRVDSTSIIEDRNTKNVVSTSDSADPDPDKVRGT